MPTKPRKAWGVLWRQRNKLEGHLEQLLWGTFATRQQAQRWIEDHYGYIRTRPELRREPYGWRMPKAVRVTITVEEKQ